MNDRPRSSAWRVFREDPWGDDDPAVRRGREALRLGMAPQTRSEPLERPFDTEVASESIPEPDEAPRRNRVGELVARIKAGDLSAVDMLRRLLDA